MELAWDSYLDLEGRGDGPLHRRLAGALTDAIRDGVIPAGSALPSSRQLAQDLRCSRWVVTEAYGQLAAEGYLEARPGSATRVRYRPAHEDARPPSARSPAPPLDLAPGLPDLRAFPRERWLAALRAVLGRTPHADLGYPDDAGHPLLRSALASYLRRQRGADVTPDTVTITGGVTDGVTRVVRAMAGPSAPVAVEDPGWTRLRDAIAATGVRVEAIPVDDEGLRVDALAASSARMVVVAAAHQFPTGTRLSSDRRDALVAWARRTGGTVVEDDYDAEFRHARDPVPALQSLAPDRVALVGSVSKTLAPAIGLGWLVAAPQVTERVRGPAARPPAALDQLTFHELLADGGYDRHLRALRRTLASRRERLLAAIDELLPDVDVAGADAGIHLLVRLPEGTVASEVVRLAASRGVRVGRLADYEVAPGDDRTLVLGYGNLDDRGVERAVTRLAEVVRGLVP